MADIYKSKYTGEEIEELLDSAKEGIPSINPNYGIDVGLPTSIVTPPGGDHLESNANITIFTKVGDENKIYPIFSRVLYPFVSSDDIEVKIVDNRICFTNKNKLYLHRVYFNWYNSSKTKRVQMFILAITNSSASLSFSGTATSTTNQTNFKNFRDACFNKTLPTMVTGSFWGNAFDYNDTYPNTPAGYIITSAKLMDHDDEVAGHEYLIITADPLARTSMDLCGEPVMHIDYNTEGTITVADVVTTLL